MLRVPVLRNAGHVRLLRGVPPNSAARLLHWWYASWAYCFQDRRARQCSETRSERPSLCPGNAVCFRKACSRCLQRALRQAARVKTGSTSWVEIWIEERLGLPKLPFRIDPRGFISLSISSCPATRLLTVAGIKSFVTGHVYSPIWHRASDIVYEIIESYRSGWSSLAKMTFAHKNEDHHCLLLSFSST